MNQHHWFDIYHSSLVDDEDAELLSDSWMLDNLRAGERKRVDLHKNWITFRQEANDLLKKWLIQNDRTFRGLWMLNTYRWYQPSDHLFEDNQKRARSEQTDVHATIKYHLSYVKTIMEMHDAIGLFKKDQQNNADCFRVLDLCMAGGGFTTAVRNHVPDAIVYGLTLPTEEGGHHMYPAIPYSSNKDSALGYRPKPPKNTKGEEPEWINFYRGPVHIEWIDIALLKTEFEDSTIPTPTIESKAMNGHRLWLDDKFHLVIADGKPPSKIDHVRDDIQFDHGPRDLHIVRQLRLYAAQLTFGLKRLKANATFIMLLNFHSGNCFELFNIIATFRAIGDVAIYKPENFHESYGSYYLVVKKLPKTHVNLRRLLKRWNKIWQWTFWPSKSSEPEAVESKMEEPETMKNSSAEPAKEKDNDPKLDGDEPDWSMKYVRDTVQEHGDWFCELMHKALLVQQVGAAKKVAKFNKDHVHSPTIRHVDEFLPPGWDKNRKEVTPVKALMSATSTIPENPRSLLSPPQRGRLHNTEEPTAHGLGPTFSASFGSSQGGRNKEQQGQQGEQRGGLAQVSQQGRGGRMPPPSSRANREQKSESHEEDPAKSPWRFDAK